MFYNLCPGERIVWACLVFAVLGCLDLQGHRLVVGVPLELDLDVELLVQAVLPQVPEDYQVVELDVGAGDDLGELGLELKELGFVWEFDGSLELFFLFGWQHFC